MPDPRLAEDRLLPLEYGPVPRAKLALMERLAKVRGLPLAVLEGLGHTEAACDAFIASAVTERARAAHAPRAARLARASAN